MSPSAPKPVAEGHLSTAPLAHVLLSVHRRGMSGTLAVWPDDERPGQDRLLVQNGLVVAARLLERTSSLERGLLPLFRRENAPYAFYDLNLLGDLAEAVTGRVHPFALAAAAIRGGAREDVVARVVAGLGTEKLRLVGGFDLAPFDLVPKEKVFLDLLRAEPADASTLLERSGDTKVARRMLYLLSITRGLETWTDASEAPAESEPFASLPGLDSLPPRVSDVPLGGSFGSTSGTRVNNPSTDPPRPSYASAPPRPSYASAPPASRSVPPTTPQAAARPSVPSPRSSPSPSPRPAIRVPMPPAPPPPPPPDLAPELAAKWRDLAREAVAFDTYNYFQMLGLPDSADAAQSRDAYFVAVKRWHPDRLPPELEQLRSCAEEVFRLLTEARETLTDDEKRLRYVKIARDGGGTPASDRKLVAVLTAAQEFEKATVLANRGRFDEALALLDVVLELDDDQADHHALKAWAKLSTTPATETAPLPQIIALCDAALKRSPKTNNERALYTKALALKRLGKEDQAYGIFRALVEVNPRHVEAQREMRLHEMRVRNAKADAKAIADDATSPSALLAKLLGKKP